MPRILLVAHWDWVLYNFRLPLARALRDEGHEVQFVSPAGEYVSRLLTDGFEWTEWKVSRRSLNPLGEIAAVRRLAAIYDDLRPDLVHHFTIKPNLYGSIAASIADVPRLINTFTGLGFVFSDDTRARWIRFALQPLMRRVFRRDSTWTILQTHTDADRLVRMRIVDPERLSVIAGSGVRVSQHNTSDDIPSSGPPVVLMASRLLRDKGVADFVAAAEILRGRKVPARFLIAGAPDPGNPATLSQQEVSRWASEGAVEFLGHRSDVPSLLSTASVAVLPSYHEGVPRFLLEAAAAGLPLVASDIEGCSMIVKDGVNGKLVPIKEPAVLADALEPLLQDAALRHRFGRESLRLVQLLFGEEQVLDAYKQLYRRWLSVEV